MRPEDRKRVVEIIWRRRLVRDHARHERAEPQLVSWEDVRIFAGWRLQPHNTDAWMQRPSEHIIGDRRPGECGFCGRPDCAPVETLVLSESERVLGFTSRSCEWCLLKLQIVRSCVAPRKLTGAIEVVLREVTTTTLRDTSLVDAALGSDPLDTARNDTEDCMDDDEALGAETTLAEAVAINDYANALLELEPAVTELSEDVPELDADGDDSDLPAPALDPQPPPPPPGRPPLPPQRRAAGAPRTALRQRGI